MRCVDRMYVAFSQVGLGLGSLIVLIRISFTMGLWSFFRSCVFAPGSTRGRAGTRARPVQRR